MRRILLFLPCLLAGAQTYSIPNAGFEGNVGQLPAGALFASRSAIFFSDRVQLRNTRATITLRIIGWNLRAELSGLIDWPLNVYLGTDRAKWRAAAPHYRVAGAWQATPRGPSAPVAGVREILIESNQQISPNRWPDGSISVTGLENPLSQHSDFAAIEVGDAIVQAIDSTKVRIVPSSAEFQLTILEPNDLRSVEADSTGAVAARGEGWVARLSAKGEPVFLTRFSGDVTARVLTSSARTVVAGSTYGGFSATSGSPQPTGSDSFIAVFGPTGQLVAGTYVSGANFWSVHDNGSAIIFGCSGYDAIATTLKQDYDGGRNIYVGKISRDGSQLLWATYVPLSGVELQPGSILNNALAITPAGEIWMTARLLYFGGSGNVLVRLSSDGSSLLHAEGLNYEVYTVRLDPAGNMRMLGVTNFSNHFTSFDAPRRGLCGPNGYYYETRTPTGVRNFGTYIPNNFPGMPSATILSRTGAILSYSNDTAEVFAPTATRSRELACIVNAADRQFSGIAQGSLAVTYSVQPLALWQKSAPSHHTPPRNWVARASYSTTYPPV